MKSRYIDRLIISSEDEEIITISRQWGLEAPFIRPERLARDDTPGIDVILHAVDMCPGFTHVLLLQPTSPLRTVEHIDGAIKKAIDNDCNCMVSVTTLGKHPMWSFSMDENDRLVPIIQGEVLTNRQDLPQAYSLNGAIYIAEIPWFKEKKKFLAPETIGFYMSPEASFDIDSELDWKIVEYLLRDKQ